LQKSSSKNLCIIGAWFFCHHSAIRPKKNNFRKSEYKNAQENASERKPKMHHPPNWYLMDEKQNKLMTLLEAIVSHKWLIL